MTHSIEYIDHDADAGLIVLASSLRELFRASAIGMLDIILDRSRIESQAARLIAARSDSTELLLVDFLSELLSLVQMDRFAVLDIEMGEMDENFTIAEVSGQCGIPEDAIKTEIKMVTYHQLDVHRSVDGRWHARLIFDL